MARGHFGEWLQGRMGADGPLVLITLPCPDLTVRLSAGAGSPVLFDDAALAVFAARLGMTVPVWPALASDIPPGCGAGASTATLVALARAIGFDGAPEVLARACIAVEGASDPLMFETPDTLLWAAREARIVDRFAPPPHAEIVGGYWGPPERTKPEDVDFPDISDLIAPWRDAVTGGDLARLATLATESAERCRTLRGPDDPLLQLVRDTGALGYARAHTGSARALIFAPGTAPDTVMSALAEVGCANVFRFRTRR